jgi:hypothetical protein
VDAAFSFAIDECRHKLLRSKAVVVSVAETPLRRATSLAHSSKLSATIRSFSSAVHGRWHCPMIASVRRRLHAWYRAWHSPWLTSSESTHAMSHANLAMARWVPLAGYEGAAIISGNLHNARGRRQIVWCGRLPET